MKIQSNHYSIELTLRIPPTFAGALWEKNSYARKHQENSTKLNISRKLNKFSFRSKCNSEAAKQTRLKCESRVLYHAVLVPVIKIKSFE